MAIEDSGFEIRDTIMWLYGSGFPKSMNIGKMYDKKMGNNRERIGETRIGKTSLGDGSGWDTSQNMKDLKATGKLDITKGNSQYEGWGTCLKPAFEPIIVARKPFKGSLVDNVIKWGVGGLNIDECRVEAIDKKELQKNWDRQQSTSKNVVNYVGQKDISLREYKPDGRFPANLILTYEQMTFDEVCGGFPETHNSKRSSKYNKDTEYTNTYTPPKAIYTENNTYGDSGSASRYFYCAKASKKDRDEGLEEFETKKVNDGRKKDIDNAFQRGTTLRHNTHPTVKPTELMQYLVRLVTPNDGIVLDPFMGSGSTGKAVMYENLERNKNYSFIGIEREEEYFEIAKARIGYLTKEVIR